MVEDADSKQSTPAADTPRAGLGRRLAALLYDGFLVVAVWFVLGYLMQLIVGPDTNQLVEGRVQTDPVLDAILFVLMVGSAFAFYAWFWTRSGQTLGMIAWRIRVESAQGGLIALPQALLRWLLAWPSFFMLGVGYLWLYLDGNGDAMHDRLSDTRVVLLPKSHRPFK